MGADLNLSEDSLRSCFLVSEAFMPQALIQGGAACTVLLLPFA